MNVRIHSTLATPTRNQLLIMQLVSALLLVLELVILALELGSCLTGQDLFDNGPLLLLTCKAMVGAVSCARKNSSDSAVIRDEVLLGILLEVLFSHGDYVPHLQDLLAECCQPDAAGGALYYEE